MRNVSNSEVVTWLSCRQQYYFAHYLNLEPKVMGTPLYRGNVGHEAFQRYAEARIDGRSHENALQEGKDVFAVALKSNPDRIDTILETLNIWIRYMEFHKGWPEWEFLSVEQRYDLPLNEDINITIRYDAMVRERNSGKILIGDYKFTYDFWTPTDHSLNGQMPKYISVMNANGIAVHGGFLEEIRTRPLGKEKQNDPKEKWRRTYYYPSVAKKQNTLKQHIVAGLEISEYWNLSDEERELKSVPVLNKHGACKYCNFKEVCASKLDGGDVAYMLSLDFKPNTYGYNNEEKEVEVL